MNLLLDQLADWLEAQEQGIVGEDIFKIHRPASPAVCISLHPVGGLLPDRYLPRIFPIIQIVAREETPNGALETAYGLFNLLHGEQNLDLGGGVFAFTLTAQDAPAYVGEEQAAGVAAHLASFNLLFDLRGTG